MRSLFHNKSKLDISQQTLPLFLIIGAQKSGTTALYDYLSRHPQIIAPDQKEMDFFSCENIYSQGIDFYKSKFPSLHESEITFDASPSYLHNPNAYKRIYSFNKDIKMIVLLRDPVDRAFSAWNMYKKRYQSNRNWFFDDWVPYCSGSTIQYKRRDHDRLMIFKEYVLNELELMKEMPGAMIEAPVIPHGIYYSQLKKYFSMFKADQILIYESRYFLENTVVTLSEVTKFLRINQFDWGKLDLQPVFQGLYTEKIDLDTSKLLSDYYKPHNKKLFELTECQYDWK